MAKKFLNEHAAEWTKTYTDVYRNLGEYLLVKYLDGNIKKERDGKFARTETGMPESPVFGGYDERYYRSIANDPDGGERLKSLILPEDKK